VIFLIIWEKCCESSKLYDGCSQMNKKNKIKKKKEKKMQKKLSSCHI